MTSEFILTNSILPNRLCFPICTSVIIAVISVVLHFCFGFWPYGNANMTTNMKHFVSDRSVSE